MTGSVLDLHCHTVRGSVDSQLSPADLAAAALAGGLTACCISEHDGCWEQHEIDSTSREFGVPFLRGMEVSTDLGHILVYGLGRYVSGIRDARRLRAVVQDAGGVMIAAHPFRNLFYRGFTASTRMSRLPTVDEAADRDLFSLVDEVEVLNGSTSDLENYLALKVAGVLGFRGLACSDAHSVQGVGQYATVFAGPVLTVDSLVAHLKAGAFFPARRRDSRAEGEPAWLPYTRESLASRWEERLQLALRPG